MTPPKADAGDLLSAVQRLTEAERTLTRTLTTASRYLPTSTDPILLPTPTTMEEVGTVLAVARTYAERTSAPSGWNPAVPIHGFVTPNPLPHQLRGGQLAALQLKEAQEERERKRKAAREERERKTRQQQEEEASEEKRRKDSSTKDERMEDADDEIGAEGNEGKKEPVDPKRRELDVMHEREDMVGQQVKLVAGGEGGGGKAVDEAAARRQKAERDRAARAAGAAAAAAAASSNRREVPVTMNLSESSSSSEEEDEEEDDDANSDS
mmetsp:Transcript_4000/g.8530  ORF Transcript_4000/g.8530 Transcript_4000/m.8530 type:complete len:267 (-) Transcript_4000:19-819(-)